LRLKDKQVISYTQQDMKDVIQAVFDNRDEDTEYAVSDFDSFSKKVIQKLEDKGDTTKMFIMWTDAISDVLEDEISKFNEV
jgi:hypothetical protein